MPLTAPRSNEGGDGHPGDAAPMLRATVELLTETKTNDGSDAMKVMDGIEALR
jgi:hypothetical protein